METVRIEAPFGTLELCIQRCTGCQTWLLTGSSGICSKCVSSTAKQTSLPEVGSTPKIACAFCAAEPAGSEQWKNCLCGKPACGLCVRACEYGEHAAEELRKEKEMLASLAPTAMDTVVTAAQLPQEVSCPAIEIPVVTEPQPATTPLNNTEDFEEIPLDSVAVVETDVDDDDFEDVTPLKVVVQKPKNVSALPEEQEQDLNNLVELVKNFPGSGISSLHESYREHFGNVSRPTIERLLQEARRRDLISKQGDRRFTVYYPVETAK